MNEAIVNGVFAIVGAAIGVAGTWVVTARYKESRKLTILVSPVSKLFDVGKSIRSEINVFYKGNKVDNLCAGEIAIQNSGNKGLEDLSAHVIPTPSSPLLELVISAVNFSTQTGEVKITKTDLDYVVQIAMLNPNERVVIRYDVIGSGERPSINVRQLDMNVDVKYDLISWIPDIYADVLFGALSQMWPIDLIFRSLKPYRLYLEANKHSKSQKP